MGLSWRKTGSKEIIKIPYLHVVNVFKISAKDMEKTLLILHLSCYWKLWAQLVYLQAWTNCAPDTERARSGAQNLWDVPDFSGTHMLPCKKKKTLDLQVFRQIDKSIEKLQWIPSTIMNTNVLGCFDNVYISNAVKTTLSTHGLGNI